MSLIKPFGKLDKNENKPCLIEGCKELAVYQCKKCHRTICQNHTIKPGILGNPFSIKLCPDCFYKK